MKSLALPLVIGLMLPMTLPAAFDKDKDKKPSITVKANPVMAFSPARVVLTADVKGGANDYEEFYCTGVEWEWGDGTKSQDAADCEPYAPGKSEIKRHFVADHVFRTGGEYRVQFRMKKRDRVVGSAGTTIKIRPGIGDPGGY
jgi:hypothetical protein